jgi:hypothetical protein
MQSREPRLRIKWPRAHIAVDQRHGRANKSAPRRERGGRGLFPSSGNGRTVLIDRVALGRDNIRLAVGGIFVRSGRKEIPPWRLQTKKLMTVGTIDWTSHLLMNGTGCRIRRTLLVASSSWRRRRRRLLHHLCLRTWIPLRFDLFRSLRTGQGPSARMAVRKREISSVLGYISWG